MSKYRSGLKVANLSDSVFKSEINLLKVGNLATFRNAPYLDQYIRYCGEQSISFIYFYLIYCTLTKKRIMKTAGWILIAVGIIMIIVKGFSVPVTKKVVDVGPIEVNKTENKWIGWPTYAGALLAVVGIVLVVTDKKK